MTAQSLSTIKLNCELIIDQVNRIIELQRNLSFLPNSPYYETFGTEGEKQHDILAKQREIYFEEQVLNGMMKI